MKRDNGGSDSSSSSCSSIPLTVNEVTQEVSSTETEEEQYSEHSPCTGYSRTDLDGVDVYCDNKWLLMDLLEILDAGTSRGFYLPEDKLIVVLNAAEATWTIDSFVSKLYCLLLIDLKCRPFESPTYSVLDVILGKTLHCLETDSNIVMADYSTSSKSFLSLQLRLHYVIEVMTRKLQRVVTDETVSFEMERLIKQSTLKSVITLLSTFNHFITEQQFHPCGVINKVYEDLDIFLCLPLLFSPTKANEVIYLLVEELGKINSTKERITLLQSLPSNLLLERVIDLHLEKHFPLHQSAEKLYNTNLYQYSESSLTKFCCVHLCRMPCKETGDICYLLFLLSSLLRSLLLRETGSPPVFIPLLITTSVLEQEDKMSLDLMEFQGMVASVKSHIPHFINRITEDEAVLEKLTEPQCWFYLQLLGNMIDLLV